MKKNCWLILGAMLSTSLMAQQATNPAPAAPIETPGAAPAATALPPAPKTNAPAPKPGKKKSGKKKREKAPHKKAVAKKREALAELRTVPLVPGPAEVVATHVNVRGQGKLKSEVVTQVTQGQTVTVIQEIVHNNSGPEEPSAWAKIALPAGAHAWVDSLFLVASNDTVRPKKLNVRSGPGENYSVIGLLHRGDTVKVIKTKGDWTEIEPPADAYAFVAAEFLKQEAPAPPAPAPAPAPTAPPPTPTTVAAAPPVAPPPTEAPVVPPPPETPATPLLTETPALTNATPAPPPEPVVEGPPPPRIVEREGIVRGMTSIQAPSKFVLISPDNKRDIDYLYTTSTNLDLRRYKGLHIIVTGEEGLDERWGNTPVLTIQKIQVLE
jgi:outer membrane biosynthesis protein TonB